MNPPQLADRTVPPSFRRFAQGIPGVLFRYVRFPDGTRGVRFASNNAERLLGLPLSEPDLLERFLQHIPPSHQKAIRSSIAFAEQREQAWEFEFPFDHSSGDRLWLYGSSAPDRVGKELIFDGALFDVTDRKETEQRRRQREMLQRKIDGLLQRVSEAVLIVNRQTGEIEDVSEAASELFRVRRDALVGANHRLLYPENRAEDYAHLLCDATDPCPGNVLTSLPDGEGLEVRTATGQAVPVTLRVGRLPGGSVPLAVAILERRPVDKRRDPGRSASSDAEETPGGRKGQERSHRKLDPDTGKAALPSPELTANLEHEFRTPITSIIGLTDLLRKDDSGDSPLPLPVSTLIKGSAQRLQEMFENLLFLVKEDASPGEAHRSTSDLREIVRDVIDDYGARADAAGVKLQSDLPEHTVLCTVEGNACRVLVRNLVSNAVKFSPEGSTVSVLVRSDEETARIQVQDDGVGMSSDAAPRIFEPFHQESEGLDRHHDGIGLGLTVVRKIVRRSEGTIDIKTTAGDGTCVTVDLPAESA